MFGWKRGPASPAAPPSGPAKQRSMPIPLKDHHQDATKLKNPSGAEQTPPEPSPPAPEFSRLATIRSADSLRRIVRWDSTIGSDAAVAAAACAAKTDAGAAKTGQAAGLKASSDADTKKKPDADSEPVASSWSWSWFRTSSGTANGDAPDGSKPQMGDNKEGGSWGFWTRRSRSDSEDGDLAISGTDTEHHPRAAEVRPPKSKRLKPAKPSLIVPQFETLPWQSRTDRLAKLLWSAEPRMLRTPPPRIKRAVVIGVHGYFPARVTRAILGEPTGTSLRFASEAERVVRQWLEKNMAGSEVDIEQVALEGEGRINHRVESLYTLLMNWEKLVTEADFVFFAVHSQGAVVALHMAARLIAENKVNMRNQRVTILAMAGSLLGPMPGMDQTMVMKAITRIEHDSLIELFELQRPESDLSRTLQDALKTSLSAGVKVVLVGSADDQLIPLYSALGVHVRHPNLFRAVYFDGDDVSPTVAAPMLNIAVQQMNAGGTDHGVVTELSGPLAGALTSKGHSKLYGHEAVYALGVQVALETSQIFGVEPEFDTAFHIPRTSANPYVLPWSTQALVSEALQNERLLPVVDDLVHQYDTWRPVSKPMKDLKWRLAGLRELAKSKL